MLQFTIHTRVRVTIKYTICEENTFLQRHDIQEKCPYPLRNNSSKIWVFFFFFFFFYTAKHFQMYYLMSVLLEYLLTDCSVFLRTIRVHCDWWHWVHSRFCNILHIYWSIPVIKWKCNNMHYACIHTVQYKHTLYYIMHSCTLVCKYARTYITHILY